MKKFNLEFTESQFLALIAAMDTISAMRGVGNDFDTEADDIIKKIDRMLKKNGYKRKYK
jgi:hypothetical protein